MRRASTEDTEDESSDRSRPRSAGAAAPRRQRGILDMFEADEEDEEDDTDISRDAFRGGRGRDAGRDAGLLSAPKKRRRGKDRRRDFDSDSDDIEVGLAMLPTEEEDDARRGDNQHRVLPGRSVNLFVYESLTFFFEYLQYMALFWAAGKAWRWPFWFLNRMRWVHVFSIDLWRENIDPLGGSLLVHDTGFSYTGWIFFWCAAPVALYLLFRFAMAFRHVAFGATETSLVTGRAHVEVFFLFMAELLYLPWAVNLLSVYSCEGGVLTTDFSVACGSASHIIVLIVGSVVGALYLVGLPLWLARRISQSMIFQRPRSFEKHMRLAEFEYLIGLSEQYAVLSMHNFSSYRRRWAYYRPLNMLQKLLVAVLYWSLRATPKSQSLVIMLTLLLPVAAQWLFLPYRRPLANFILHYSRLTLAVHVLFGHLSVAGVRSAVLVPTSLYFIMNGLNIMVLFFFLVEVGASLYAKVTWPVHRKTVVKIVTDHGRFVSAVEEARALLEKYRAAPSYMFVDPTPLGAMITRCELFRVQAKRDDLPIEQTLASTLEDMIILYNTIRPVSLLPFPKLEQLLPAFCDRLARRDYELLLVPTAKRAIALKLLCLRTWMGSRKIKRVDGPVESWPKRSDIVDEVAESQAAARFAAQRALPKEKREAALLKQSILREVFADDEDANPETSMDAYFKNMGVVTRRPIALDNSNSPGARAPTTTPEPVVNVANLVDVNEDLTPALMKAPPLIDLTRIADSQRERERRREAQDLEDDIVDRGHKHAAPKRIASIDALVDREHPHKPVVGAPPKPDAGAKAAPKDAADASLPAPLADPPKLAPPPPTEEKKDLPTKDQKEEPSGAKPAAEEPKKAGRGGGSDDEGNAAAYAAKTERLQAEKKRLRQLIKDFEVKFEADNGRKATHADKKTDPVVVKMFADYKAVDAQLKAREETQGGSAAGPVVTEEAAKEAPKEATKETPKEVTKEATKEATKKPEAGEASGQPGKVEEGGDQETKSAEKKKEAGDAQVQQNQPEEAKSAAPTSAAAGGAVTFDPSAPVPEGASELTAFSEQGLAVASAVMDKTASHDPLVVAAHLGRARSAWKKLIKKWEKDFTAREGNAPTQADKQAIKPWFALEKLLKVAIGKLDPSSVKEKE